MRRVFLILTVSIFLLMGCEKKVSETKPQNVKATQTASAPPTPMNSPQPMPSIPKDGDYPGKGVVTKIDEKLGSVELNHEDIPGLMPPMIMEFYVKDKALLKDLKVGDKVDFTVEYKHPTEVISSIKKAQ
jgi:Cu/Ag efflux protein CusF